MSLRVYLIVEGRGFHVEGEGSMSRVEGSMSRVEGSMSRARVPCRGSRVTFFSNFFF